MSVELWKVIFDWATVVLIALTVLSGAGALITGDILNKRQEEKLREFQEKLTDSQTRLSEQQERTLALQKQVISQGSRVALLYPEKTWERLIEQLKPFSRQKAEIRFCTVSFNQYSVDNEAMALAMKLRELLDKAGWLLAPLSRQNCNGTGMTISIGEKSPESTQKAADGLRSALLEVPFMVGSRVFVTDLMRSPQPHTIQDGKEWIWNPVTQDTIVLTVYSHP